MLYTVYYNVIIVFINIHVTCVNKSYATHILHIVCVTYYSIGIVFLYSYCVASMFIIYTIIYTLIHVLYIHLYIYRSLRRIYTRVYTSMYNVYTSYSYTLIYMYTMHTIHTIYTLYYTCADMLYAYDICRMYV